MDTSHTARADSGTTTYWVSFADENGSRGYCIVDVGESDLAHARDVIGRLFPNAQPDAERMIACIGVSRAHGCNPGPDTQVVAWPLQVEDARAARMEKYRLYSRAEIDAIGREIARPH
jgi:hypothetical protein